MCCATNAFQWASGALSHTMHAHTQYVFSWLVYISYGGEGNSCMGIESKIKAHSILSMVQHGSCDSVRALCAPCYMRCVYRRSGSRSKADIIITKQKCRSIHLVAGTASVAPTALPLLPPFAGSTPSTTLYIRVEYTLSDRRHINSFSVFAFDFNQFEYILVLAVSFGVWVFWAIIFYMHSTHDSHFRLFRLPFAFHSPQYWFESVSVFILLVDEFFGCWPSQSEGNSCLFSNLSDGNSFNAEQRLLLLINHLNDEYWAI